MNYGVHGTAGVRNQQNTGVPVRHIQYSPHQPLIIDNGHVLDNSIAKPLIDHEGLEPAGEVVHYNPRGNRFDFDGRLKIQEPPQAQVFHVSFVVAGNPDFELGEVSSQCFILTAQVLQPDIVAHQFLDARKNLTEKLNRRAHGFDDGALQEVHPRGTAEIQGEYIKEYTDKNEDEHHAAEPAEPGTCIKKSHNSAL